MARIVIAGATGTIGQALVEALRRRGDAVVALSRNPRKAAEGLAAGVDVAAWPEPKHAAPPADALAGADAVVNLLGEPIAQRWSGAVKREIRDSRVLGTRSLVEGLGALGDDARPSTFVSQSATGFYGPTGEEPLDEAAGAGNDFLARVVLEWEQEASAAEPLARVVLTRTGVVLARHGGALAAMLPAFRLGVGGPVAGGRQYVSWIHIDDVVGGLLACLEAASLAGPVNLTAPTPVTNGELSRTLGRVLHRPAALPVPAFALRVRYGEMAQVVTTGQRVLPGRLQREGYEFRYPQLEPALRDVLGA
jgi:uncharacterized protein (TIGR01777 family)